MKTVSLAMSRIFRTSFILGTALIFGVSAEARRADWSPDYARKQLRGTQSEIDTVALNYEQRRGIIGSADAENRFNEAVIQYLMGNYKFAAESFFVLLETESLDGYEYEREAEWYLTDSAFRIEQYALLEQSAYRIIEQPGHMFFTDAVRLLLESYGRRSRPEEFQEIYRRFVITGQVESSDALNYSIGKSFYFQGESSQAKQALFEIQNDSNLWFKAQYFLGGVYVSEGNLEQALSAFEMAINPDASNSVESELNDLARMAIARVHYEQKEFLEAVSFYEKVPYASPYFIDRLYETAWSLIGLERWEDAIEVIRLFIEVYPDSEHTPRFKNTLGDLYLQIKEYELAQKNYTQVIAQLEPVYLRLRDLMEQDALVQELLDAKLADDQSELDYGVPEYIQTRLYKDPILTQTVDLVSLATEQRQDVKNAQAYIEEIGAVLGNEERTLYSFVKDQRRLSSANELMLYTLLVSLENEAQLLIDSSKNPQGLRDIQSNIARLRTGFEEDQHKSTLASWDSELVTDPLVTRIQKVQQDARNTRVMTNQVLDELEDFLTYNSDSLELLPAGEKQFILDTVQDVEDKMKSNQDRIRQVINDDAQALMIMHLGKERFYRDQISRR